MSKRITLHGVGDADAAALRDTLARAGGALRSAWSIGDGGLALIDIDTVYGHMDWLRAQSSGKPVAVLTEHTQFNESDLVLHKPLDADNIVDVLNRADPLVEDRVDAVAAPSPQTPTPPPVAAPATVAPATPEPSPPAPPAHEKRLSDWLADGALRVPVRLREPGAVDLVIDPQSRTWFAEGNLKALAPYCSRDIAPDEWQEIGADEIAALRDSGKMQPIARALWAAHALGGNGQLAPGLDVGAKYKLSRWPQIEREFPKHFRIATVMMKQPATLADIAEQSGASLADVIDFTSAYNAIGYVESDAARPAGPAQRDSGRGAILSRLRNPFGGG